MTRRSIRTPSTSQNDESSLENPQADFKSHSKAQYSRGQSVHSDKENYERIKRTRPQDKRPSKRFPMSAPPLTDGDPRNKRKKVNGTPRMVPSQAAHQRELEKRVDKRFYDPDQDVEERRATKKGLRSLISKLNDSRAEYLQADSKGLLDTLSEADELYKSVKQTSDATIDSRLLVATADLSYRKVKNLALGESAASVDVDDFVTKCIAFMRQGDDNIDRNDRHGTSSLSTGQSQRRRRFQQSAEDDDEDGDTMNWEYLGRNACLLHNFRPCLSGFLLGPLSVQKKVRQQSQRRAKEGRADASQAARPIELSDIDREKQESESLTVICAEIAGLLNKTQTQGKADLEKEYELCEEDLSEQEMYSMMRRHGLANNGCVPLLDFCVNPRSFGQTVENFFYVSFLVKEGKVGLDFDSNGMPTLGLAEARSLSERQETQRNQAVFTLDFDVWEDLVRSCGIAKSIIPHRKDGVYDDGTLEIPSVNGSREDSDAYG